MSEISERIRLLIEQQDMSYGELSKITGISKSALQRYVTGETAKIPLNRLEIIANALHTTPAYIMGWDRARQRRMFLGIPLEDIANELDVPIEDLESWELGNADLQILSVYEKIVSLLVATGKYNNIDYKLSANEIFVIELLRTLNEDGVERVKNYLLDISSNNNYRK